MALPFFIIPFSDKIDFLTISPYEFSKNIICIASKNKITIGKIKFREEFDELEHKVEFEHLEEFFHRPQVYHIAISPTSLDGLPSLVQLCAAGSDFSLRVFTADLTNRRHSRKEIEGHDDYVNGCSYDPSGEYLASVSDDLTCKLWAANDDFSLVHTFYLSSPGKSICWQTEQPNKFIVAEKGGIVRVYSTLTMGPIRSVMCSPSLLVRAEWPSAKQIVFLASGIVHKADITVPGHNVEQKLVHPEGGIAVASCPSNNNLIATAGRPSHTLQIINIHSKIPVLKTNLTLFGGMSWHSRQPILCVADNSKLNFYRVTAN